MHGALSVHKFGEDFRGHAFDEWSSPTKNHSASSSHGNSHPRSQADLPYFTNQDNPAFETRDLPPFGLLVDPDSPVISDDAIVRSISWHSTTTQIVERISNNRQIVILKRNSDTHEDERSAWKFARLFADLGIRQVISAIAVDGTFKNKKASVVVPDQLLDLNEILIDLTDLNKDSAFPLDAYCPRLRTATTDAIRRSQIPYTEESLDRTAKRELFAFRSLGFCYSVMGICPDNIRVAIDLLLNIPSELSSVSTCLCVQNMKTEDTNSLN